MAHFDYIIAGAGCAGLSLLVHLIHSGKMADKHILLADQVIKTANDHTWCFWEEQPGMFEQVVSRQWSQLDFHGNDFSKRLFIAPYTYKMIRADDFYRYCFELIRKQPNVEVRYGHIEALQTSAKAAILTLSGQALSADYIFSSVDPAPFVKQPGRHYLLQHFKGWTIETDSPVFDAQVATLMDFRLPQHAGTSFMYLLPLSARRAMIEYTIFSASVLPAADYVEMLRYYISTRFPGVRYKVLEEEYGIIPMTTHDYPGTDGRIVYLGTAGGQTKASTGYTFQPIQAHARQLTAQLVKEGRPFPPQGYMRQRFRFYDCILLRILTGRHLPGDEIFTRLFRRNSPQQVFKFLDERTTWAEELRLTMTLQKGTFIKAALSELYQSFFTSGHTEQDRLIR